MTVSVKRIFQIALPVAALWLLGGCLAPGHALTPGERAVAAAARPILTLDPDAVWTDCFNRLVELGPTSIAYLMEQPAMTRPAAPDDLSTLLHTSLIRLLAGSAGVPHLSATSFETTLNVLHFDLKVDGRRIGTIVMARPDPPHAWHEFYPADFDHTLAARVNVEADRRALREWWLAQGRDPGMRVAARRLVPQPRHLWRLLARRYADRWQYQPEPRAVLCATASGSPALLDIPTYDYNLVRAACIWLGSTPEPAVEAQLIGLVGSPSQVAAHNARFALHYAADERIRATVRRYDEEQPQRPDRYP